MRLRSRRACWRLIAQKLDSTRRGPSSEFMFAPGAWYSSLCGFALRARWRAGPDGVALLGHVRMARQTVAARMDVPASVVLHTRYSVDSSRPWLGVPPWSWAATTSQAIAALDKMVAREARAPHGSLLGVPASPQLDEDGDVRPLDAFRSDLAQAKGRTLVMESVSLIGGRQTPQEQSGAA